MPVLKCKMCGGNLNVEEGATTCTCEYCGTTQTIPKLDDEKKNKLYDRANRLRFNNEFDKAYSVYQDIINDFPEEAEAYWGLLLCKYGIEYVEDPYTLKRIPTCHRSSFESIFDDDNFEMVMENADPVARDIYRAEAKAFEEIRKGILEVSSKEEPYDIFICYKETDEYNNRTIDSVIAQDVYNALTEKGYRVFFSRISLEDKLGQEYEPYIFAALNSAKVMLVLGTKYDYFNAVWVKNEWSRYLQLIAKGDKKTLIPCYRDIDAYDMPREFIHLQSQDIAKVGAVQDLVRGIEKIIPRQKTTTIIQESKAGGSSINTEALLRRANIFLEDGDFKSADEYFDRVLDIDPENGFAYFGKMMVELGIIRFDKIDKNIISINNQYFIKAKRYANGDFKNWLIQLENDSLLYWYDHYREIICNSSDFSEIEESYSWFNERPNYKESQAILREFLIRINSNEKVNKYFYKCSFLLSLAVENNKMSLIKDIIGFGKKFPFISCNQIEETANDNIHYLSDQVELLNNEIESFINKNKNNVYLKHIDDKSINDLKKSKVEIEKEYINSSIIKLFIIPDIEEDYKNISAAFPITKLYDHRKILINLISTLQNSLSSDYEINNYDFSIDDIMTDDYFTMGGISSGRDSVAFKWNILNKDDNSLSLISNECIAYLPFDNKENSDVWENSSLFNWLNLDFMSNCFSASVRKFFINGISILSEDEYNSYKNNNDINNINVKNDYWWLKRDKKTPCGCCVNPFGVVVEKNLKDRKVGVRPIIIIDL